jgi:Mn-dependent DtxR family transcriptional regulator
MPESIKIQSFPYPHPPDKLRLPVTSPPRRTSGSVAMDDYLEQILHLIEAKGYARAVDVSKNLGISQASVTNMLQRLDAEGLVKHEKYRGTILTEEGHRIARAIIERHETLTRFLRLFGIDEETIYRDVEGMEHHVSRPTLNVIRAVADALEDDPTLLERVREKSRPRVEG